MNYHANSYKLVPLRPSISDISLSSPPLTRSFPSPLYRWPRPELHTDYAFLFHWVTLNFMYVTDDRSSYFLFTSYMRHIPLATFVPHQSNCIFTQNTTYPWFRDDAKIRPSTILSLCSIFVYRHYKFWSAYVYVCNVYKSIFSNIAIFFLPFRMILA